MANIVLRANVGDREHDAKEFTRNQSDAAAEAHECRGRLAGGLRVRRVDRPIAEHRDRSTELRDN
jgi:hypothetical protein